MARFLQFDRVSFAYPGMTEPLLADVTAGRFIPGDTASIRTVLITDLAATLATILFVYLVQDNIKNERRRTTYFVCTSGYTVLLAAILILTYAT